MTVVAMPQRAREMGVPRLVTLPVLWAPVRTIRTVPGATGPEMRFSEMRLAGAGFAIGQSELGQRA